jgi:hypothetical protein
MNEMVVKVMGNTLPFPEDISEENPGGYGPNGSGPTAYNRY